MSDALNHPDPAGRRVGRISGGLCAVVLALVALAAGGCGGKAGGASTTVPPGDTGTDVAQAPISNIDACAMRLHDLCAPLLLYYATNQALPERLEELREVPGFEAQVQLTCPVSNQPYVYNRFGLPNPERTERVIIYDPTPAHSGFRWAVSIIEPRGNGPLVTKVIALPESQFHLNIPH